MAIDDNSVNIKRSYHHGDLRSAVVAAAIKRLEAADGGHVSLREVARDVGVSATAIYRHFPDKDQLLDALAFEAAEMLGLAQMAASAAAGGGQAGFSACGRAYVVFALEHPALFRLMGSRADLNDTSNASKVDASTAMRFLNESVDGLMPRGATNDQRRSMALHAWSLVHGLALLMLDGHIPREPAIVDSIIGAGDVPSKFSGNKSERSDARGL